ARRVRTVPAQGIAELAGVLGSSSVAGLAGDPELGHLRVEDPRRVEALRARLGTGVVAEDAVLVPDRAVLVPVVAVGIQEHGVEVEPARFAHLPEDREPLEPRALAHLHALEVLLVAPGAHRERDLRASRRAVLRGHVDEVASFLRERTSALPGV